MFEAHGNYILTVSGKILFLEAYGPWNVEAAEKISNLIKKKVIQNFKNESWAMLASIYGEGIYTPDSIQVLQNLHRWRIDNGLTHIAIINNETQNLASKITKMQFNSVYDIDNKNSCTEKYFNNKEEALLWLSTFGFN